MENPTPGQWKKKVRDCLRYVLRDLDVTFEEYSDGRIRKANEARERMSVIAKECLSHLMGEEDMSDLLGIPRTTAYFSIRSWKRKHGESTPPNKPRRTV